MKKNKSPIATILGINSKSRYKKFPIQPLDSEKKEIVEFYNMLLKIEKKRTSFNAKRLMKRIYPSFFKITKE